MSISDQLVEAVDGLTAAARERRWRAVVVLAGARRQCLEDAQRLLQHAAAADVYWFGDGAPPQAQAVTGGTALRLLGTETDALVFDAWSGFDPDAFGALAGTVRAGGLLLLLTPALREWSGFDDPQKQRITVAPWSPQQVSGRYLGRLARLLASADHILLYEAGAGLRGGVRLPDAPPPAPPTPAPYRTPDQQQAVAAVVRVASGHRRRPVVLTSDRGRGKSAAFGIAAAQLIRQGRDNILLTGPSAASVAPVLEHARALLPEDRHHAIRFVAPDELAHAPQKADLVLVDEAAAIPAPLLETLLKRYARIAFATTVHGYEGTGRGFAVRFNRILDNNSNSWKTVRLSTPVRWADGDPLEALTFRLLLLDANAAPDTAFPQTGAGTCTVECLDRDALLDDEATLGELFGLLVLAHYRTRPLDLRHLLDGPNVSIHVLRIGGHIAGTALVADEGGFDAEAAQAICAGRSRPHGHLLPETLAAYQGLCEAPGMRCARVMRVAVHPAVQRRGLGARLIEQVVAHARESGCDYVGSSFGATPGLLDFWQRMDWLPVRVGFQRGASSGCHSVVVMKPLSARGNALAASARERFFAQFPHQLCDSLRDLEAELVVRLMRCGASGAAAPTAADWEDARAFAFERRLAETSIGSLWRVVCFALMDGRCITTLETREISMLVARVLQRNAWQQCASLAGVAGRDAALALLRSGVAGVIRYHSTDSLG